jgi:PEP-CTERM motif
MYTIIRKAAQVTAALCFGLVAGVGSASPIVFDQWYTFGFADASGDPLIAGAGFVTGIRSIDAPDPAWTFTCATTCVLTVTDGFQAVDQFELFDFGASIGSTSAPSGDRAHTCSNDELACLADPEISHGFFILAAGDHSITGLHLTGLPGAGFLILAAPEPGTVMLIGLGLLALVTARRRS